ncbi:hypothetical protein PGQ11_012947 [Apiospora arundinis]|uniref:Uncharacterized protein n=1 Tax=Apiospora arundinis TaxID=335852 RepID=A0ABR2I4R4_9PEZI
MVRPSFLVEEPHAAAGQTLARRGEGSAVGQGPEGVVVDVLLAGAIVVARSGGRVGAGSGLAQHARDADDVERGQALDAAGDGVGDAVVAVLDAAAGQLPDGGRGLLLA